MLASQRQEYIYNLVNTTGGVRVAELVEELGVSEMTVRRDISELVARGMVERVHGGAVAIDDPGVVDIAQPSMRGSHRDSLLEIGELACSLLHPGDAIFLGAGRTCAVVARQLVTTGLVSSLRIITNSVYSARILTESDQGYENPGGSGDAGTSEVYLLGGRYGGSGTVTGPYATQVVREMSAKWAIFGTRGITQHMGCSADDVNEADVLRNMANQARYKVLVATVDKWGNDAFRSFAPLNTLDYWVTNSEVSSDARVALQEAQVNLIYPRH